jgi:hypothetical protein
MGDVFVFFGVNRLEVISQCDRRGQARYDCQRDLQVLHAADSASFVLHTAMTNV